MAKSVNKETLAERLRSKSPQALRQAVQPVDILAAASAGLATDTETVRETVRSDEKETGGKTEEKVTRDAGKKTERRADEGSELGTVAKIERKAVEKTEQIVDGGNERGVVEEAERRTVDRNVREVEEKAELSSEREGERSGGEVSVLSSEVENRTETPTPQGRTELKQEALEHSDAPEKTNGKSNRKKSPIKANENPERKKRSEKPRIYSDETIRTILTVESRQTERYSFEIYSDQKEAIEHLRRVYEQKTGGKLTASRLIREILDSFLPEALAVFSEDEV